MRFGVALELWCKGDPDAAAPPKPKTPADTAREKLLAMCKKNKLDPRKIAERFNLDYGLPVAEADSETILAFTTMISDQIAIDQAAAKGA
jgi:hypothetical protein